MVAILLIYPILIFLLPRLCKRTLLGSVSVAPPLLGRSSQDLLSFCEEAIRFAHSVANLDSRLQM